MPHLSFPLSLEERLCFWCPSGRGDSGRGRRGHRSREDKDRLRGARLLPPFLALAWEEGLLCTQAPFFALARVEASVLYALGGGGLISRRELEATRTACPSGAAFEKPQEKEVALGMSRGTQNYTWAWPTPCPPCTHMVCACMQPSLSLFVSFWAQQ